MGLGDLLNEVIGGGTAVPNKGGANFYASLLPSIIEAGTSLAGTYFTLDQQKQANDQAIAMRQAELDAAKEAAKGGGGGGGGQKLAALTSLYNNWASNAERSGESLSQSAQATGKMGQDPLIARLAALR